ncbi:hypothetical protein ACWV26_19630 [Rummeliibacillus sp. JY-2-4R]
MKNWEYVLRDYIIGRPVVKLDLDEDDSSIGQIVDAHRGLTYGYIELSDDEKLTSFMIDMDEIMENNDISLDEYEELTPDELIGCAEDFVKEFCRDSLHFNMMTEWNGISYLIVFEAKDVALNLFLPNSGATIEINKQGFVLSATLFQSYYQLAYPDIQISAEDAKNIICQHTLVELGIYEENGEMELVYYPKKEFMGVHVDGHIVSGDAAFTGDFMDAHAFEAVTVTKSIESLLGVTNDMYQVVNESGRYWYRAEDANNISLSEPIIKIEQTDEMQLDYESLVKWAELDAELPVDLLENNAKIFLETVIGDIHEKYLLEEQLEEEDDFDILSEEDLSEEERQFFEELEMMEEDVEDDFDEEDIDFEPFTTFTFIRYHKGIRIEDYSIHVNVGIYTGLIRDCTITLPNELELTSLDMNPNITLEQADALFKEQLQMKLARTFSYDEEDEEVTVYGLDYIVSFQNKGRIQKIDAMTGEVQFVDADILKEGE